jgi:pyruvate ferredoxin oxidoreductase gamma subunit
MFQIRIHGRGGQGVVTAAEILSLAAFSEGRHSQAFPSFGSERMGAPVMAFCRISIAPIRSREPVLNPNALIIQDPTLLHQPDLFNGLAPDGFLLINSTRPFLELGLDHPFRYDRCFTVPATEIARKHTGRPVPNAALIGAFAAATRQLSIDSVLKAIRNKFGGKVGEANAAAAQEAYGEILLQSIPMQQGDIAHARTN